MSTVDLYVTKLGFVAFVCTTLGTRFIFTKKSNTVKGFFDICNAEIAQCRKKLDAILVNEMI